jgi:hypothetical protein
LKLAANVIAARVFLILGRAARIRRPRCIERNLAVSDGVQSATTPATLPGGTVESAYALGSPLGLVV